MSDRFGRADSAEIWAHLNALDDDRVAVLAEATAAHTAATAAQTTANAALAAAGSSSSTGKVAWSSGGASGWYRVTNAVEVEIYAVTTSTVAAGAQLITGVWLPAAYRPSASLNVNAGGGSYGDRAAAGQINSDGTLNLRNNYSSALVLSAYIYYRL